MQIKKILHQYYKNKLQEIEEREPMVEVVPVQLKIERKTPFFTICRNDVFGYLLMAGMVIHFLLGSKFFNMVRLFPGITFLF